MFDEAFLRRGEGLKASSVKAVQPLRKGGDRRVIEGLVGERLEIKGGLGDRIVFNEFWLLRLVLMVHKLCIIKYR